jgi:hypothetical protein
MSSASNVSGRRFRSNVYFFSLILVFVCVSAPVNAQMFSVKPQRETIELPGLILSAGVERMDVSYAPDQRPVTDFSFSADLLRLQLESGGLVASYSTGRGLAATHVDYTSFELALASGFQLIRRDAFQAVLPFYIYSVNTTMTSRAAQMTNSEFRQNALGLRTGFQAQVRMSPRTRLIAFGTGGYAFSANGFNSNGGSISQWDAGARLHMDGIFRSAGLTAGAMIHQRSYDVDIRTFNYDLHSVSFLFGVTL